MRPGDSEEVNMSVNTNNTSTNNSTTNNDCNWTKTYMPQPSSELLNRGTIVVPTPIKPEWGMFRPTSYSTGSVTGTIMPSRNLSPTPVCAKPPTSSSSSTTPVQERRYSPELTLGVSSPRDKLNSRGHPLIRMKKPNKAHLNHLEAAEILCFTQQVCEEELMNKNLINSGRNSPLNNVRLPSIGSLIGALNLPQETPETAQTQEQMEIAEDENSDDNSSESYSEQTTTSKESSSSSPLSSPPLHSSEIESKDEPNPAQHMITTAPVKKRTDIDNIIEKTHDMLPAKEDPKFFDITHLLTLPQADAAKAVRLSKPTFCKRWKEAVGSERKWPHRYILKIDREIRQLKSQQKRSGSNKEIEDRLAVLTQKRKVALTPTSIRL